MQCEIRQPIFRFENLKNCSRSHPGGGGHDIRISNGLETVYLYLDLKAEEGQPSWLSGLAPPSAQGMILETLDRVPRQAPCMEPASPSACVSASLCVCVYSHE